MNPSQSDGQIAWVRPAAGGIPGLVDVRLEPSGEALYDLTMGQFRQLAAEHDWDVRADR